MKSIPGLGLFAVGLAFALVPQYALAQFRSSVAFDIPIQSVTVYSDRARVVREGDVGINPGPVRLDMVRLPESVQPDSVRMTVLGGRLGHVTVRRIRPGELPKTQAQALIDKLRKLHDEEGTLQIKTAAEEDDLQFLRTIQFQASPLPSEKTAPLLLNSAGWGTVLRFFNDREGNDATGLANLERELLEKQDEIAHATAEAQQLLGMGGDNSGYTVSADVDAKATTIHVTVAYVSMNARWYPAYDIHYTAGAKTVDVGLAGLVSQQTGEDWMGAKLTLSTAVPSAVTNVPELAVWRIGDRERFLPTPVAGPPEGGMNPFRPQRPVGGPQAVPEDEYRNELLAELSGAETAEKNKEAESHASMRRQMMKHKAVTLEPMELDGAAGATGDADAEYSASAPALAPPPAPPPPMAMAAPMAQDMVLETTVQSRPTREEKPAAYLNFRAPHGWMPPQFAGDLPAALAEGYDFSYDSAQRESIHTGAEAHRVALYTQTFPAEAWVKILPALSKSAFLVAEVTNTGTVPLLRGMANLFVGSDLVGDATIKTLAPGEKATLPLGIDDAVRVERNVQLVASERGLFQRLEVGGYDVVDEVLNTHQTSVPVRVYDQVPLARQQEVVIALDSTDPPPFKDDRALKEEGALEWRLDVAAGAKRVVRFHYEVAKPKGWKLWQTTQPGVNR